MSRSLRRYEILLPLRFSDGRPVPDDFVADTLLERIGNLAGFGRSSEKTAMPSATAERIHTSSQANG
jgi:hypothetical protein